MAIIILPSQWLQKVVSVSDPKSLCNSKSQTARKMSHIKNHRKPPDTICSHPDTVQKLYWTMWRTTQQSTQAARWQKIVKWEWYQSHDIPVVYEKLATVDDYLVYTTGHNVLSTIARYSSYCVDPEMPLYHQSVLVHLSQVILQKFNIFLLITDSPERLVPRDLHVYIVFVELMLSSNWHVTLQASD